MRRCSVYLLGSVFCFRYSFSLCATDGMPRGGGIVEKQCGPAARVAVAQGGGENRNAPPSPLTHTHTYALHLRCVNVARGNRWLKRACKAPLAVLSNNKNVEPQCHLFFSAFFSFRSSGIRVTQHVHTHTHTYANEHTF